MSFGSIIQISSLETGDRIIVTEKSSYVPSVIPVTYPDADGESVTTRYFCLDKLPEHIRKLCEDYMASCIFD